MRKVNYRFFNRLAALALVIGSMLIISCGGGGSSPPPTGTTSQDKDVTISWNANNEKDVNATGGGYNVYISQNSNFNIGDAGVTVFNVPWVMGTAPTSIIRTLSSGTYYVRVAAYTAFPAANTASVASDQITVSVPFTLP